MADLEPTRWRQREPLPPEGSWWLVKGRLRFYIARSSDTGSALNQWLVFQHDIHTHSGKHRHQGGLAIFVLEGEGYTEVDGVRIDWEAGDLILLPIKPDGCEHQHFNRHA